tara:strand:+ start:631 stop:810 length:180 start_codon:yes stop_codon:yes gene_type:complete
MSWKRLIKEYTREDSLEYLFGQVYETLQPLEYNVKSGKDYSDDLITFKKVLEDLFKELE